VCWKTTTPHLLPFDVITATSSTGSADQTFIANVSTGAPVDLGAVPGGFKIQFHGFAADAAGAPLPAAQVEHRIVTSVPGQLFDATKSRTLRAGGPVARKDVGSLVYDAPGSINWTATYILDQHDHDMVMNASGWRALWLGRVPANFNELTIEEANNAFHGPTPACVGSAPASPPVTFTPAALTFTQAMGTTSAPSTITVTNVSTTPNLAVTGVAIDPIASANPGDFAIVSDTCTNASLALEASCTVGVTFTPVQTGGRSAFLSITDNASGSPQNVALKGNF
jgi:hypothetical protein